MRSLTEIARLRLLLAGMAALQAFFLVLRARPYGASAHGLLALTLALTVTLTTAVALVPGARGERFLAWLMHVAASRSRAIALLLAATVALGLASVSTQQPFSWDERGVLGAAELVAGEGVRGLFAHYADNAWLGPQHPPLVPLLYGAVATVTGPHLKVLRVVNLLFGCGTVVLTFLVFERLYDRRRALLAALLLLASPLFVRIASAATNDMPLAFFFVAAVLVALHLERSESDRSAVLLGLVIGLGLLVKYTMLLVFPVLVGLAWQLDRLPLARRVAPVVLAISLAFLLAWLDQAYALGVLGAQQHRLGRLAGVSVRHPRWALDALVSKTPAGLGVAVVPWIVCGAVVATWRRTVEDRVVLTWIALVFLPLFLTLPDNRYFLPAYPALAVLGVHALLARPRFAAHALVLAWLLCAVTLLFYARIDLAQKAFLFS
jgi:4-amino-4-deoxy-L-arabinose transferase-like glycosyltransferase